MDNRKKYLYFQKMPMSLYTIEDADYIITYYKDKIIGKVIEESTISKITHLDKEYYSENQYRVNAYGTIIKGSFYPKRSIDHVLKDLGLRLPLEILKNRPKK